MACHAAFSNSAPALLSWKHARVEATPFPERHPMLSQLVPVRSSFQGLSMNATMRPRCTTFPKVGVVTSASLAESHAESKPSCCRRELLSCLALSAAALSGRAEAAAGRIAVAELTPTKGSTAKGEIVFRIAYALRSTSSPYLEEKLHRSLAWLGQQCLVNRRKYYKIARPGPENLSVF